MGSLADHATIGNVNGRKRQQKVGKQEQKVLIKIMNKRENVLERR